MKVAHNCQHHSLQIISNLYHPTENTGISLSGRISHWSSIPIDTQSKDSIHLSIGGQLIVFIIDNNDQFIETDLY